MGIFGSTTANFNVGEKALLEQLINLIINPETTEDERLILIAAKNDLEQKTDVSKVVNDLLNKLVPVAVGLKMSPQMKIFL
ncbi:bacteriocin immunity protein [Lactococcus sp.]|uniref:bacteriocin immunity protein n=1 Tax=Lactococcus sp. TaxID=44273 RepID=UPI002FC7516E